LEGFRGNGLASLEQNIIKNGIFWKPWATCSQTHSQCAHSSYYIILYYTILYYIITTIDIAIFMTIVVSNRHKLFYWYLYCMRSYTLHNQILWGLLNLSNDTDQYYVWKYVFTVQVRCFGVWIVSITVGRIN
jgi:hypothetical protein